MVVDAEPFWIQIIITFTTTLTFLFMLCCIMMYRSRVRHNKLTNTMKRVRLDVKPDVDDSRAKIISSSLKMVQYKMDPPITQRPVPCFVPGVCHDVRLEARNVHEKLRALVVKIPEISARAPMMTFREIVTSLQSRLGNNVLDEGMCNGVISFHEEVRFGHSRYVSEEEWKNYIKCVETILDRTKSMLVM